jgi:hypothetical protein
MPENDGNTNLNDQQGGGSGNAPAWISQLSDDLKSNETFTSFKTISDLGKSYLDVNGKIKDYESKLKDHETLVKTHEGKVKELEGKITSEYIPKPKENATEEEKLAFYKALGRPDKPDDYKFEALQIPKGAEKLIDPTMEPWFRATAHKLNFSNEQAAALYAEYGKSFTDRFIQMETAKTQKMQSDIENLKKAWGAKFDENVALMDRAYAKFAGKDFKKRLTEMGLNNDMDFVGVFLEIGKAIADDTTVLGRAVESNEPREPGVLKYPSMEVQA